MATTDLGDLTRLLDDEHLCLKNGAFTELPSLAAR